MDNDARKRKRRNVLVFRVGNNGKDFAIDEEDYRIMYRIVLRIRMKEIRQNESKLEYATTMDAIQALVEIREEDEKRRIYKLHMSSDMDFMPELILELDALEVLEFQKLSIEDLPKWVVKLKSLKELRLIWAVKLKSLPEDIGCLTNLETLNLNFTWITSLPDSIGKMKNLKNLFLRYAFQLTELPNEICLLTNLCKLNIAETGIK